MTAVSSHELCLPHPSWPGVDTRGVQNVSNIDSHLALWFSPLFRTLTNPHPPVTPLPPPPAQVVGKGHIITQGEKGKC